MNCREFENRFQCLLDDRLDPAADADLCAHASDCPLCGQLLAGQEALFAGLAAMKIPPLASQFSRHVVSKSAVAGLSLHGPADSSRPTSRAWLAATTLLASAAAVLLALSTVWYARGGATIADATAEVSHEHQSLDLTMPRRSHGGGLAMTRSNLLIEAPRLPEHVRGGYRGAIDNLAVALPETVEHLHDVERLAPGIRPIRVTFSMLWDALCEVIPGYRERPQPSPESAT